MFIEKLVDERKKKIPHKKMSFLSIDRISAGMNAQNGANIVRIVVLHRIAANKVCARADSDRIEKIE